jgi:DNA-binding transcriptional MerR regulator
MNKLFLLNFVIFINQFFPMISQKSSQENFSQQKLFPPRQLLKMKFATSFFPKSFSSTSKDMVSYLQIRNKSKDIKIAVDDKSLLSTVLHETFHLNVLNFFLREKIFDKESSNIYLPGKNSVLGMNDWFMLGYIETAKIKQLLNQNYNPEYCDNALRLGALAGIASDQYIERDCSDYYCMAEILNDLKELGISLNEFDYLLSDQDCKERNFSQKGYNITDLFDYFTLAIKKLEKSNSSSKPSIQEIHNLMREDIHEINKIIEETYSKNNFIFTISILSTFLEWAEHYKNLKDEKSKDPFYIEVSPFLAQRHMPKLFEEFYREVFISKTPIDLSSFYQNVDEFVEINIEDDSWKAVQNHFNSKYESLGDEKFKEEFHLWLSNLKKIKTSKYGKIANEVIPIYDKTFEELVSEEFFRNKAYHIIISEINKNRKISFHDLRVFLAKFLGYEECLYLGNSIKNIVSLKERAINDTTNFEDHCADGVRLELNCDFICQTRLALMGLASHVIGHYQLEVGKKFLEKSK